MTASRSGSSKDQRGWVMIEVLDTAAAGRALARRKLPCPGCRQPLPPWGRGRELLERSPGDVSGEKSVKYLSCTMGDSRFA